MAHRIEFTLNPDIKYKLRITWNGGYFRNRKDIVVSYNNIPLKAFAKQSELYTPQTVQVPGQQPITISLAKDYFEIKQNDEEIGQKPPDEPIKSFYSFVFYNAILSIVVGLITSVTLFWQIPILKMQFPALFSLVIIFVGILMLIFSRIGDNSSIQKLVINIILLTLCYVTIFLVLPFLSGGTPKLSDILVAILYLKTALDAVAALRKNRPDSTTITQNSQ